MNAPIQLKIRGPDAAWHRAGPHEKNQLRAPSSTLCNIQFKLNKRRFSRLLERILERTDLENQPTARRTFPSRQKRTKEKAADPFESAASGGDGGIRTHVPG